MEVIIFAIKYMERSNFMFLVPEDDGVPANDPELEVKDVTQGVPFACEIIWTFSCQCLKSLR